MSQQDNDSVVDNHMAAVWINSKDKRRVPITLDLSAWRNLTVEQYILIVKEGLKLQRTPRYSKFVADNANLSCFIPYGSEKYDVPKEWTLGRLGWDRVMSLYIEVCKITHLKKILDSSIQNQIGGGTLLREGDTIDF